MGGISVNGIELKIKRLMSSGRAVIVACDHGEFDGPIPGMINIAETVTRINKDVDGVLLSPGMIRYTGDYFTTKGAPQIVGRLNWDTVYCFHWGYNDAPAVEAFAPDEAAALGVEIALVSLTLRTGSEERDAHNVQIFRTLAARCHSLGLPVIGEYFPAFSDTLEPEELHRQVKIGSRILAELGADMIKSFYTCHFEEVTAGCPAPILALGAAKLPTPLDALHLAYREVSDGAQGVVFGRNALQVDEPLKFQAALLEVVKRGARPGDVWDA
jgi:DhnA family fructose-bisphosphate aldolase class Ia